MEGLSNKGENFDESLAAIREAMLDFCDNIEYSLNKLRHQLYVV